MAVEDPRPALRRLAEALDSEAHGLGLRLVQFDCAQAFADGSPAPQEFFQAMFVMDGPSTDPGDQHLIDAEFRDIEARLTAQRVDDELASAIDELRRASGQLPSDD